METLEIKSEKIEIKKNLLDELLNDKKEETLTKEMLREIFVDKDNTLVIILLYKSESFKQVTKPYNLEILDRKMSDWVINACNGYEIKTVACDKNSNIVSLVKPLLNEKQNNLVLYSDVTLLIGKTIT